MTLQAQNMALFFTVVLMAITAYFLLGSVPLLMLRHDDPVDAQFVRSFYTIYYRMALLAAVGTAVSYAFARRPVFVVGAVGIAALTLLLRSRFIPMMDRLGAQIQAREQAAIATFRKTHKSAILINTSQLLVILGSLGMV